MKPTEAGYYWLRQNWKSQVSGEIKEGKVELVLVGNYPKPRSREPNRKYVMMVLGRHWQEELSKMPDYCQWRGPICEPEFPTIIQSIEPKP